MNKPLRMIPTIFCVLIGLAGCTSSPPSSIPSDFQAGQLPPEYPAYTVFDNVNVLTMSSNEEKSFPDYRVVIRQDEITALGPRSEISIPDGAQVIDGNGRYLLPGFIDSHVHLLGIYGEGDVFGYYAGPAQMSLYLQQGITTIRAFSGRPRNGEWRDKVEKNEWLGTRIVTSGPVFGDSESRERFEKRAGRSLDKVSQDFSRQLEGAWPSNEAEATAAVNQQYDDGYDFTKIKAGVTELTPAIFEAIAKAVRAHDGFLAGHIPALIRGQVDIEYVLRYEDEVAHIVCLMMDAYKPEFGSWEEYGQRLADTMIREDVSLVFNWSTDEVVQEIGQNVDVFQRPAYKYIPDGILSEWKKELGQESGMTAKDHEHAVTLVSKLINAGVIVQAGSDTGDPGSVPELVHRDLELMVSGGVTNYQALVTATRNGAQIIARIKHNTADFGEIKAGYKADLVLLEANPLTNISNTRKRVGVMVDGHWFTQEQLDKMAAAFKKMPLILLKFE